MNSDNPISLCGFDSETVTTADISSPPRPTDPRKEAAIQATAELPTESTTRRPLGAVTGTANNTIWTDSSSEDLMCTDSPTADRDAIRVLPKVGANESPQEQPKENPRVAEDES